MKICHSMKRVFHFLLLILTLLSAPLCGQNNHADSLWHILRTEKLSTKQQIGLYIKLSLHYGQYDTPRTIECLKAGLNLSEREGEREEIPFLTRSLGVYYNMLMQYDSAKIYLDKSLEAAISLKDRREEVQAYRCIAHWNYRQNRYIETLDNCMTVHKISEEIGDTLSVITALINIGSLYRELGNLDRAEHYILQSIEYTEGHGLDPNLMSYYELGLIYMKRGELDLALEYELKALEVFRLCYKTFEIYCSQAIAQIYTLKREYTKAIAYAEESIRLAKEYSDTRLMTIGMQILSTIYREQQRYDKCAAMALAAWSNDSTMIDTAPELAYNLAYAHLHLGNKDKSAHFFRHYARLVDEQKVKAFHKTMADMEIGYETEKKQMQIDALKKEKRTYTLLSILGLFLLLSGFGLLYYHHRLNMKKRELAENQVKQLRQKQQLVATLALLDGENTERSRLSRDLHDGLGSLISIIKLQLRSIKGINILAEIDRERFDKALAMLDQLMEELRRVVHNMMPDALSRFGVKAALEDLCHSIPIADFRFFGTNPRLDSHIEVLIYRCAYELINNVLRHAQASSINVQLTVDAHLVSLSVRDDGVGFDPETVVYGTGLTNMHHRISAYRGKIDIYSIPGEGTEVTIEIELPVS